MHHNNGPNRTHQDFRDTLSRESQDTTAHTLRVEQDVERTMKEANVSASKARSVLDTLRRFATFSELLRIIGAAIMVGSLSLFMLQGWLEGNDIQRYLKLLAQTVLLTAGGFGLSVWLKEQKGARLFFSLSLASVAANFTILGALIYSIVQFDGLLGSYPAYAAWVSQSPFHVMGITTLALAILVPVTRLAFTVLARPAASWLTTTYLIGCAALLLPVRGSVWSSLLAVGLIAFVIFRLTRSRNDDRSPGTAESRFSVLMLFAPAVILCVRSFYFYQVEELAIAAMAIAGFVLLRHMSLRAQERGVQQWLDCSALPLPFIAAVALTAGVPSIPSSLLLPSFALFLMPMMGELVLRRPNTTRSVVFGLVGATAVCLALLINVQVFSGIAVGTMSLFAALLVVATGYWLKRTLTMSIGVVTAGIILIVNLGHFLQWFHVSNWVLLSILGAGAIIMASLLDRYGAALKLKLDALRAKRLSA